MKSAKEFKAAAREQLCGKWSQAALFTLGYLALAVVISMLEASFWNHSIITTIVIIPASFSYVTAFLEDKRTGAGFNIASLFAGYNDCLRIVGTYLLTYVYIFLWILLFIIPGIIKSISYSQVFFILKDNPELSYNAAIERSMAMMDGHKLRYFWLGLTFIGWIILGTITFGIAYFWVLPYMTAAMADFYEEVKKEYENKTAK